MTIREADGVWDAGRPRGVVRSAVIRFATWSLVTLALLVAGAVALGGQLAEDTALREARSRSATIAHAVAAPLVDGGVRAADPGAIRRLDEVMRARLRGSALSHVKLWSDDGTVIWSDQPTLVGRQFRLEPEVAELFGTRATTAEVSTLSKPENAGEQAAGELLEVYVGTHDVDQRPFVFEAYLSTEEMRRYEKVVVLDFLPLAFGSLLLFQAVVLPLAISLARRVEKNEADRSRLMEHSLLVAARERRRIAQDLHDGVLQDLAGLSYAMPVVEAHLPDTPEAAGARDAVRRVSSILHRDVTSLRELLVDILPPDLEGDGLSAAVEEVAARLRDLGVEVQIEIPPERGESIHATMLAYRVVREGLRNVVKHARASHVHVRVQHTGSWLDVEVTDDGVGIDPEVEVGRGHLGLKLLADTLQDVGGRLSLKPRDGGGTTLRSRIPAQLLTP